MPKEGEQPTSQSPSGEMGMKTRLQGSGSDDAPKTLVSTDSDIYRGARDSFSQIPFTRCVQCDI